MQPPEQEPEQLFAHAAVHELLQPPKQLPIQFPILEQLKQVLEHVPTPEQLLHVPWHEEVQSPNPEHATQLPEHEPSIKHEPHEVEQSPKQVLRQLPMQSPWSKQLVQSLAQVKLQSAVHAIFHLLPKQKPTPEEKSSEIGHV